MENIINLAKEIVYEVDRKVRRVYWTNEKIDKFFGKRSVKEILDNGTTCFMNPCLDLTLISSYLMSSQHISNQFIIEEHGPTKEFPFNRLHFVLEFQNKDREYSLNYKKCNEVYISNGNYNGREDIPQVGRIKIPGEKINPYKSIHENLGYTILEELIQDKFVGFSLEKSLNRLKSDNSQEKFKLYNNVYGNGFKIIIKPQNQLSL
jgi:hypothetical protein